MPVWYTQLKPWLDRGELVILGVIQEQHADRCRLFQQWKQMDFPVVQDALNVNGIAEVPVYLSIDERGIIRSRPRRPQKFLQQLQTQDQTTAVEPAAVVNVQQADPQWHERRCATRPSAEATLGLADSLVLWDRSSSQLERAATLYQQLSENRSDDDASIQFRLGVVSRMLYEAGGRSDVSLFETAVRSWESALQLNPNQYIYRRRIEQYGPRLKKPYSFYDWVAQARRDIQKRGEQPQVLQVEPNGAELAERARQMTVDRSGTSPDPARRLLTEQNLVQTHVNLVPSRPRPGDVVAVHVGWTVTEGARWNHEASSLKLWVEPQNNESATVSTHLIVDETEYGSSETETPVSLSFEVQIPATATEDIQLNAYGVFHICETASGQCVYRRHDFTIQLPVTLR